MISKALNSGSALERFFLKKHVFYFSVCVLFYLCSFLLTICICFHLTRSPSRFRLMLIGQGVQVSRILSPYIEDITKSQKFLSTHLEYHSKRLRPLLS